MSDQVVDETLKQMGLNIPLTINQQAPTKFKQNQFLVNPSAVLVNPSSTGNQLASTGYQLASTKNQLSQQAVGILSEQAQQAKADLEVLVATGKTKDFTGKQITFSDLDNMTEKDLLKYFRIYQSALAVRVNDTFSKAVLKTYAKITNFFLPIADEEKLYEDLRKDYVVTAELDKWTGWLTLKMGCLMAVAATSLITVNNVDVSQINVPQTNLFQINGESGGQHSQSGGQSPGQSSELEDNRYAQTEQDN